MSSPRQRTLLLVASHSAALALGILIFRGSAERETDAENTGTPSSASAAQASEPAVPEVKSSPTRSPRHALPAPKNSVHLVAWKTLASEGLTRPERMKASAVILKQWINDDWQSALDTVMSEPPDDFALLVEFQPVIAKHPEEVWSIIEQRRYGMLTKDLRGQWDTAVRKLDDASLEKLASSLSGPGGEVVKQLVAERTLKRNGPAAAK